MLQHSYDSQEAIPENKRGAYVQKDGKWVLDELDASHPVLVNNRALKSEKEAAQSEAAQAKSELASANVVPRGHKAVPSADADLLDKVKAHGTPEEVERKLAQFGPLSEKVQKQERRARLDEVRKSLGWNADAVDVLEMIQGLPEIEDRDAQVGGETKKVPHAKIVTKTAAGDEVSYKPFADYFAEKHKALLPSVVAQTGAEGVHLPEHGAGGGTGGEDLVGQRLSVTRGAGQNPLIPKPAQPAAANA